MDVSGFLDSLRAAPDYAGQIGHVHTVPETAPVWQPIPHALQQPTTAFLHALGIERLYDHQARAIEASLAGDDVLVTTGPASGKSLCYQVPVLESFLGDSAATAMLVFPAKALAHDQVEAWGRGTAGITPRSLRRTLRAVAFDADSSTADRRNAREAARLIVTNPEMLHIRLLPGHARWSRLFANLRYVVIDELHTYTGFFGANMANVLRRLERVCAHYGSSPRYVCMSATVGNPLDAARRLTGRALRHVTHEHAGAGSRTYVFWSPPRISSREWRGRRSANVEAHELLVKLVVHGVPTICFSKARNTAEMVYRYARDSLREQAPHLADRLVVYRGGYSAEKRREMEQRLRNGEILGVSATRALELGIDIGSLEACIQIGYPGTLNAFFQQTGRAGRTGGQALCFLVGIDTPINQFIMQHPEFIFDRPIERTVIDRDNPFVVLGHVRCAAAELPVGVPDLDRFGYSTELALDVLTETHKLHRDGDAWYHAVTETPSADVRLRGWGDESTVVTDQETGAVIDRIDKFRALRIFYEGAVYFHHGDTYAMVHHDTGRNVVTVRRADVSYYTDPVTGTSVNHIDAILDKRRIGTGEACLGEVFAVLDTPSYERVRFYTLDRISQHPTNLPPVAYEAMSFWVIPPAELVQQALSLGLNPSSGLEGILYCVSRVLPLFHTSDANDFDWSLGCTNAPDQTMFWYEFYLHGIGHAEQSYERLEEILNLALEHLLTCDCEDGCPNCTSRLITPYHTRNIELGEGVVRSRVAAAVILDAMLHGRPAAASLELVRAPRERRGMAFLPTVTAGTPPREPHRMPLDQRTRTLMMRKIERSRKPKQPLEHAIDPCPSVGIPPREPETTNTAPDPSARAGSATLKRRGDPLARKLRTRLDLSHGVDRRPQPEATSNRARPHAPKPQETTQQPLRMGDSLARRARKRHRSDTQTTGDREQDAPDS
ncbi:MAG: DEAD/DEAH box helicase [Chitinivibrionales bacterium]|nr:DEAD/DEAH box helicase [Chitinivibrionales bacterium]